MRANSHKNWHLYAVRASVLERVCIGKMPCKESVWFDSYEKCQSLPTHSEKEFRMASWTNSSQKQLCCHPDRSDAKLSLVFARMLTASAHRYQTWHRPNPSDSGQRLMRSSHVVMWTPVQTRIYGPALPARDGPVYSETMSKVRSKWLKPLPNVEEWCTPKRPAFMRNLSDPL